MFNHPHLHERRAPLQLEHSRPWRASVFYAISDVAAIVVAATIAFLSGYPQYSQNLNEMLVVVAASLVLAIPILNKFGLYNSWRGRRMADQAATMAVAWSVVFSVLIVFAVLIDAIDLYDRQWGAIWFFLALAILIGNRLVGTSIMRALRRRGWNRKRVLIVGDGPWGNKVAELTRQNEWMGVDIVGFVRSCLQSPDDRLTAKMIVGEYKDLPKLVSSFAIDDIWCCMPLSSIAAGEYTQVREQLAETDCANIGKRLIADPSEFKAHDIQVPDAIGLSFIDLGYSRLHELNRFAKDMEDRILASVALIILSPVWIAIAVAIKLTSKGPVLFKQARHGWDGRPINIYKFRTMFVHEEENGHVTQATKDDVRITWVGRLLRRTSLDELPQFFNVLQGRMSLVGPRPHAIQHNEYYESQIDVYMRRHRVRPGITGWAQVNGLRGETETLAKMKARVEYDLYYIDNWSLWFDIKIVLMTIRLGFVNKNAY